MGFSYIMEGGNPLVGFHLMGFHLDNIDGSYGTLFHNMVKNNKRLLERELKNGLATSLILCPHQGSPL